MSFEEIIFLLVFLGIPALFVLVSIGLIIWENHCNKQFTKNHSDYLKLWNKVVEKENEVSEWNKLINQKKKAIDEAFETLKYVPAKDHTKIEAQIEIFRNELAEINNEARPHFEEAILLRDKFNKWRDELIASGELKEF